MRMKDRRMILRTYQIELESCCRQLANPECEIRSELIDSIKRVILARKKLNRLEI